MEDQVTNSTNSIFEEKEKIEKEINILIEKLILDFPEIKDVQFLTDYRYLHVGDGNLRLSPQINLNITI